MKKVWQEHNRHLHNTDDYKYLCDTCSRGFFHLGEFKAHRAKHTNIKWFTCGICKNASFAVISRLQKHLETCGKEGNVECKTCGKLLSDVKSLNTHIAKVHNDTIYICKICEDRTYTSQGGYYRHMRSMHNIRRNGQKLRDVLKEISANATPDSVSDKPQNQDDDLDKSKKKSDKRKNTQPDPKPKKPKKDNEKSNVVTWDRTLCPGVKFSDNYELMQHLYKDHQIRAHGNAPKK